MSGFGAQIKSNFDLTKGALGCIVLLVCERELFMIYPRVIRVVHWVIGLAIIVMLGLGFAFDLMPQEIRAQAMMIHKTLGWLLLWAVILRVGVRLSVPLPPFKPWPCVQQAAATALHLCLYGLMLLMPLSGWAMSSAFGRPVVLLNLWAVPNLVPADKTWGMEVYEPLHNTGAFILLIMVGLHVAAALWHHFVARDEGLRRMWPRGGS
jgi:cytochrome b561